MAITVLLAEDHEIVRRGIKSLLEKEGFTVLAEAADGQEALRLAGEFRPDVAALDISMPLLDGLDAVRRMARASPNTRTLLLTVHRDVGYVLKALRAGAFGYVIKARAADDLGKAIREVVEGRIFLSPALYPKVLQALLLKTPDPAPHQL